MKNLVIGVIKNYDWSELQPFVCSLKETGYKGKTILFYNNISLKTLEKLKEHSVTTIPFTENFPYLAEELVKEKGILREKPLSKVGIFSLRHMVYYFYLKNSSENYENIMITDVRDVIFQKDPFNFAINDKLCCFLEAEDWPIKRSSYNADGISKAFGEEVLNEIGNNLISCAGTIIGPREKIADYLEKLLGIILGFKEKSVDDQIVHNYLLWKGMIGDTAIFKNHQGPILTMGYEKKIYKDKSGKITDRQGNLVSVLHQYDRHYFLSMSYGNLIFKKKTTQKMIGAYKKKINDYLSAKIKSASPRLHKILKKAKQNA